MNSFKDNARHHVPIHTLEWESRKFIDRAVKSECEYSLEVLAMALCGSRNLKIRMSQEDKPIKRTKYYKDDDGNWFKITNQYKYEGSFNEWMFYANTKAGIYIEVIKFWMEKKTVYPIGAAAFPNTQ